MKYKIQVWSPAQKRWRTAYARSFTSLKMNVALLHSYGFIVR